MTTQQCAPLITQGATNQAGQQPINGIPDAQQQFPVRTLKVFGGIQIGLGVVLAVLSTIGVAFDAVAMQAKCHNVYSYSSTFFNQGDCWWNYHRIHNFFAFDITCLVSSAWFILTGFLPMCMSRKRADSWRGLRVGFMVCSIIGAAMFAPTMFSLGVVGSILRSFVDGRIAVLSGFITVLSFAELVIAITAASYCCCCTPWKDQQTPIMLMRTSQPGVFVSYVPSSQPITGMMDSTMATGQSTAGMENNPRGQQYVITTSQPQQYPHHVSNRYGRGSGEGQQTNITDFSPPAYKE